MQLTNGILVAIFVLLLVLLQVFFGFLQMKNKKAFAKYHQILGIVIFLVLLANIFLLPAVSLIGIFVLTLVLAQIIIGIFITMGKRGLIKFHKPLGFFIFLMAIANLVMASVNY